MKRASFENGRRPGKGSFRAVKVILNGANMKIHVS
jgi:hypothetical protein